MVFAFDVSDNTKNTDMKAVLEFLSVSKKLFNEHKSIKIVGYGSSKAAIKMSIKNTGMRLDDYDEQLSGMNVREVLKRIRNSFSTTSRESEPNQLVLFVQEDLSSIDDGKVIQDILQSIKENGDNVLIVKLSNAKIPSKILDDNEVLVVDKRDDLYENTDELEEVLGKQMKGEIITLKLYNKQVKL